MKEERVMDAGKTQELSAGSEQEIVSELGTVTKQTKGFWIGLFYDGGQPPFCKELLPLSGPDEQE